MEKLFKKTLRDVINYKFYFIVNIIMVFLLTIICLEVKDSWIGVQNPQENFREIVTLVLSFGVAYLIIKTTMEDIITKQKSEIATLKALGFNDFKIKIYYIIYALIFSLSGEILSFLFLWHLKNVSIFFVLVLIIAIFYISVSTLVLKKELNTMPGEIMYNENIDS